MSEDVTKLVTLPVAEFLDRLAGRAPTPGGGAVAALAGALACAMARMVGAYSIGKKTPPEQSQRVEALCAELERADHMLRQLVAEDAVAYEELALARRRVKVGQGDSDDLELALAVALAVPMEIAAVASGALRVMTELRPVASEALLSDLGVAAVLADACAQTAAYSVRVNAAELPGERQRHEAIERTGRLTRTASQLRREIEATLPPALRPSSP